MATSFESICTTCNHFKDCILRSNRLVWDCSEFDNEEDAHFMTEIQLMESIEAKVRMAI